MPDEELPVFDHDGKRFVLQMGVPARRGANGVVRQYSDTYTGENVAIKMDCPTAQAQAQRVHRGIGAGEVLARDGGRFGAYGNVVPSMVISDGAQSAVIMPWYEKSLDDKLREWGFGTNSLGNRIDAGVGTARGIAELHKNDKVHGDISQGNVMWDESQGKALVTDTGTATVEGAKHGNPRDNVGSIAARAYECFREGGRPSKGSDVMGLGAFFYGVITGGALYQEEINNLEGVSFGEHMRRIAPDSADATTEARIRKKVPKPFQNVLIRAVKYNPRERHKDAPEFVTDLERAVKRYEKSKPLARMRRWGIAGIAAAAALAVAGGLWSINSQRRDLSVALMNAQSSLTLSERMADIRQYVVGGASSGKTSRDVIGVKRIQAWVDMFGDRGTAFMADLNTPLTVEAVEKVGSRRFKDLENYFRERDPESYYQVLEVTSGYVDNWAIGGEGNMRTWVDKRWNEAKREYDSGKRIPIRENP